MVAVEVTAPSLQTTEEDEVLTLTGGSIHIGLVTVWWSWAVGSTQPWWITPGGRTPPPPPRPPLLTPCEMKKALRENPGAYCPPSTCSNTVTEPPPLNLLQTGASDCSDRGGLDIADDLAPSWPWTNGSKHSCHCSLSPPSEWNKLGVRFFFRNLSLMVFRTSDIWFESKLQIFRQNLSIGSDWSQRNSCDWFWVGPKQQVWVSALGHVTSNLYFPAVGRLIMS